MSELPQEAKRASKSSSSKFLMPLRIFKFGREQIIFYCSSESQQYVSLLNSKCSRRLELEIPSRNVGFIKLVSILKDLSVEELPLINEPRNYGKLTSEDALNFRRFGRKTSTGVSSKSFLILSSRFVKASNPRRNYGGKLKFSFDLLIKD